MSTARTGPRWILWGIALVIGLVVLGWILKRIVMLAILAALVFVVWTALGRVFGRSEAAAPQRADLDDFERRMQALDRAEAEVDQLFEDR